MSEAIYTAASGAAAQQMRLELLANNLANVDTAGFKEDNAVFSAFLPGTSPSGPAVAAGGEAPPSRSDLLPLPANYHATFGEARTSFSPGALKSTGNPLDLALDGDGFFVVQTAQGQRYTRRGAFSVNEEGTIVTSEGHPVLGEAGPIRIEPEDRDLQVDEEGNIHANGETIGTLQIMTFDPPYPLRKAEGSLFAPMDPLLSGRKAESVTVRQGQLEMANVDAVRTMIELIEVHRIYEACQKMMRTADDATGRAINDVGRLSG